MKSYVDVTNFISQQIASLSLTEQIRFLQHLLEQFVRDFPADWLAAELEHEKPHYQAIFEQISHQTWQADVIEQQLGLLDDIMFAMGDAYPHRTSEAILVMMDILGYYLSLIATKQKSDVSDGWTTLSAIAYLDYMDEYCNLGDNGDTDFDNWLDNPNTAIAFDHLKASLAQANAV